MKKLLTSLTSIMLCTNAFALAVDVNEPRTIIADKIEYNLKSDTIKTTGNTEIVNKSGQKMTLTDSYISQQGQQVAGDDIKIWLGSHVYVESDNITRDNGLTVARRALFTACDGCDSYGNAWDVWAYKIVHNLDKRTLKFYSPLLYAYDFPVFWVPYFEMPDPGMDGGGDALVQLLRTCLRHGFFDLDECGAAAAFGKIFAFFHFCLLCN